MRSIKSFISLGILLFCGLAWAAESDVLFGHKWSLVILEHVPLNLEKFPDQKPYIEFNKNLSFSANVGCNPINGTFTLTEPKGITLLYTTNANAVGQDITCSKENQDLEAKFIAMLQNVKTWQTVDNSLEFISLNDNTVAIFVNLQPY